MSGNEINTGKSEVSSLGDTTTNPSTLQTKGDVLEVLTGDGLPNSCDAVLPEVLADEVLEDDLIRIGREV